MARVRSGFLIEFSALKDVIGRSRDAEAGKAWLRTKKFIEKGGYSKVRYDGEFASLVLGGYDDEYLSRKYSIAPETVRGHRKRIGDALVSLLGEDFCQLFYNYKENSAEISKRISGFEVIELKSCDLFPKEVYPFVSSGVGVEFDLKDCVDEIEYLREYSLRAMESKRDSLDMNKLDYLINVIDGLSGTSMVKVEVMSFILPREEV